MRVLIPKPDKIPETDEEIRVAIQWLKQQGIIPERKLEVDSRLADDLRDILALYGAGSIGRQFKANVKRGIAQKGIFILLALFFMACPVLFWFLIMVVMR